MGFSGFVKGPPSSSRNGAWPRHPNSSFWSCMGHQFPSAVAGIGWAEWHTTTGCIPEALRDKVWALLPGCLDPHLALPHTSVWPSPTYPTSPCLSSLIYKGKMTTPPTSPGSHNNSHKGFRNHQSPSKHSKFVTQKKKIDFLSTDF
jgi:hypothetical protein